MALAAPTADELLQNPIVMQALDQAWADSLSHDPDRRHEEGGWIYMDVISGMITVVRAPAGYKTELELTPPAVVLMSVVDHFRSRGIHLGTTNTAQRSKRTAWLSTIMGARCKMTATASTITSDQALCIARIDAESAYRDLSCHQVLIRLEEDGWHVDYSLKSKTANGGSPHYLIDPSTGKILWKTYQQ